MQPCSASPSGVFLPFSKLHLLRDRMGVKMKRASPQLNIPTCSVNISQKLFYYLKVSVYHLWSNKMYSVQNNVARCCYVMLI